MSEAGKKRRRFLKQTEGIKRKPSLPRIFKWELDSIGNLKDIPHPTQWFTEDGWIVEEIRKAENLWISVLKDAITCFSGHPQTEEYEPSKVRLRKEAEEWFFSESMKPGTFLWLCHCMDFCPMKVLRYTLKVKSLISWRKKGGRSWWESFLNHVTGLVYEQEERHKRNEEALRRALLGEEEEVIGFLYRQSGIEWEV